MNYIPDAPGLRMLTDYVVGETDEAVRSRDALWIYLPILFQDLFRIFALCSQLKESKDSLIQSKVNGMRQRIIGFYDAIAKLDPQNVMDCISKAWEIDVTSQATGLVILFWNSKVYMDSLYEES